MSVCLSVDGITQNVYLGFHKKMGNNVSSKPDKRRVYYTLNDRVFMGSAVFADMKSERSEIGNQLRRSVGKSRLIYTAVHR